MYFTLVTLHVLFAGIWLTNILVSLFVKLKNDGTELSNGMISFYLKYTNLTGILGAMGILITGVVITLMNPAFQFFQFTANHWLTTKQIIMVAILAVIFAVLIPTAKALRLQLTRKDESVLKNVLEKINRTMWVINSLVIINILLALSRRFM
ncbi:MAG: hypothetical protein KKB34_04160 [Bacteroidetes bacterium]|nr:hypothetical protein [Bacteroidota bacterium]